MNSPDATIVSRWTGTIRAEDDGNVEGSRVIIDGVSTNSFIIPFVDTVNIESLSLTMNHDERGYFFKMYTSVDGADWTEVTNIAAGAEKGDLKTTYDKDGYFGGPGVNGVWRTNPCGGFSDDIGNITISFASPTASAKFLKITFYGHDGARGDWEATDGSQWMGFNNLSVTGSVAVEPESEPESEAPAAVEAPAVVSETVSVTPAPQTSDPIILIVVGSLIGSLISAAGINISRKRK
jgi:hypothetical protein